MCPRLPTIQAESVAHPLFPDFWRKPRPTQLPRFILPKRSSQGRPRRWERRNRGGPGWVPGVRAELSARWARSRLRSQSRPSISRARVTRLLKEGVSVPDEEVLYFLRQTPSGMRYAARYRPNRCRPPGCGTLKCTEL